MKIVLISSNKRLVPPPDYGSLERIIYYLANSFADMGHEVIVYAKRGSHCRGTLLEYPNDAKNNFPFVLETLPSDTDIIHDHTQRGFVSGAILPIPTLCTIHNQKRLNIPFPVYVSNSHLQETGKGVGDYVYNGIRLEDFPFSSEKDDYLLFMGRIFEKKGTHFAIEVAKQTGHKLIIAGPIPKRRGTYFHQKIEPHIDGKQIKYVGSVGGSTKMELLKRAKCVLFPTDWPEPFGLVPIEAMTCGTPVICFRRGAVPETMEGLPELQCDSVEQMVDILKKRDFPDAFRLREYVRSRFSADIMAKNYLTLYKRVIEEYKGGKDNFSKFP